MVEDPPPAPPALRPPISVPVAERRRVSILFVDLVGFTALAEDLDPEDVRDLLDRYFETCRKVIGRHGGAVEKFIGDAVMAMWGAPIAYEDDAERAVRAAIDLVGAVGELRHEPLPAGLAARAAVVSGEAAVTLGAVGQGMVAGDVVNTASRLQAAATPGTVLVDEETFAATRLSIAYERSEDRALRGKRAAVPAWEARRVVALRRGERRSALPEGPLVGRGGAIRTLRRLLRSAREDRVVRFVSVFGEAGIGKSRIVWELEKYVDGIVEPIRWHHAGSPAYGEGLSFWALAEMVRQRARIADDDEPEVARQRLVACLAEYVPDDAERRWIGPRVATLLGLGPAPAGDREEAFAAWRTFFERIADQGTTILVFDDLHWADGGMLDFIEEFAARATGRPILLVAVARPELRDRRPGWGAGVRDHVAIELQPLARDPMAELLRGLAPDLPRPLADRILDRAEGVPLYAIEILRMLVDQGDLEPAGGAYQVRRLPERVSVPASLHALVAARLDTLDPDERTLVRQAAVLGDSFRATALAAVAGEPAGGIETRLRRLIRHEMLVTRPDDRWEADPPLQFSHALIREVAYATLARRDRRSLHLAAADHYAGVGDPELSGDVASHVLAAYHAGPVGPTDLDLARRVIVALRTAAERAASVHDHDAALGFLEEALTIAADRAERVGLHEGAAAAAQAVAQLPEAEAHARAAQDGYRQLGDGTGIARAATRLGSIQVERYDVAAIRTLEDAVAELGVDTTREAPALVEDPSAVELIAQLARAYLVNGRTSDAVACADRALRRAERLHFVDLTADALAAKGAAVLEECRAEEGIALLRAALDVADEHGLVGSALRARSSLALGLIVDDPGEAIRIAGEGLEIARRVGFRDLAVRVASNWAEAAFEVGAWDALDDGLTALERDDMPITDRVDLASFVQLVRSLRGVPGAMSQLEALAALVPPAGEELADATLRGRRAWALLAVGRPLDALAEAEATGHLARTVGRRTAILGGSIPAAHAALWAGDLPRLENALDELSTSGLRGRWFGGVVATLEAGLAARRGDPFAATERYERAAGWWRGLEPSFEAALCSLEAAWLLPAGSAQAVAAAVAAERALAALGAEAFLDRLRNGLLAGT
jgi:class 3 adenylate cyclase/tetratricopeptide (TPR) repeat protein